ncbi:MAG: putative toxin-antitoxin system toxin component, PIN family [Rhizobiales bacterium]|nr:putative toxin-antitoxin system toxin component, PIN family [Hyphomicrobiales bacterium]
MRLVLDTNVVVSAMRSPMGASAELLKSARRGEIVLLANVALALEYEAICLLAEHRLAAGLDLDEVGTFVDAVIAMAQPVETHFLWRPHLRDPADELVLEAAVNGHADAIVTFNHRDFGAVPSRFGLELLLPVDVLRKMQR